MAGLKDTLVNASQPPCCVDVLESRIGLVMTRLSENCTECSFIK